MSRSYLVNLLVEVHIEGVEDWNSFEDALEDRYLWEVSHDEFDAYPYLISSSVESWAEVIDGIADHG